MTAALADLAFDRPPAALFFVAGISRPAGSKTAFPHSATGRMVVTDASGAKGKAWRAKVASVAFAAFRGPPLTGPLEVWMEFTVARPKRHFRTGRFAAVLRDEAEHEHPTGKPDLLKVARAVEDSLTGVIYADDALIVAEHLTKRYGAEPGVRVCVRRVA